MMKVNSLIAPIILSPILAFANIQEEKNPIIEPLLNMPKHTVVIQYSNYPDFFNQTTRMRSDFPTQIVRVKGNVASLNLTCNEVNQEIDHIFIDKITSTQFFYNTYIFCQYNPETHNAVQFSIHSYFDPINDEAIHYLQDYLNTFNGYDLLGTPFKIESAKGVVVALTINAGFRDNKDAPLTLYHQSHSNFYFKHHFELRNTLISDIRNRIYSKDPDQLLSFFDTWVFPEAGKFYRHILSRSNYIEIQPEMIFLMKDEPKVFVSNLKYYYGKDCSKSQNQHCL